jgi:hypothetical protein
MSLASLFDILLDFLSEDGWAPESLPGESMARLRVRGENGEWDAFVLAREADQQIVVYAECPLSAPTDRRTEIMTLVTRANFGLSVGNFELDLDDGEIRYRTSLDVKEDRLSPALLRQLVWNNIATTDRYLPALRQVIESGATAAEALAKIESHHTAENGHHHRFRFDGDRD